MSAVDLFTLADLKMQVALNLGATDDLSLAKCGKYINRALVRFSEMGEWSWQRVYAQPFPDSVTTTTSNGVADYTVKECLRITNLYMRTPIQRRLVMLGERDFRRMYPNDTATGTPYYYTQRGRSGSAPDGYNSQKIGLYPIPDGSYTLLWDGVRAITLLSSDTDDVRVVTGMPVRMVDILIEMATAIGWKEIDDGDAAVQMNEVLMRLKAAYADDTHDIEDVHVLSPLDGDNLDKIFDPILPPAFGE